jgi:putative PIN family toxin of toxin-antitoxin system
VNVVLDTNVLFGAFASRGAYCDLLNRCLQKHRVVISKHIVDELVRGLVKQLRITPNYARTAVSDLSVECSVVVPLAVAPDACRDPDDLPVLGTALAGTCDHIVTGDRDLLSLRAFKGIAIVSPRRFLELDAEHGIAEEE